MSRRVRDRDPKRVRQFGRDGEGARFKILCTETYAQVRALQLATTNVTERTKVADLRSVGWKRPQEFESPHWYFSLVV